MMKRTREPWIPAARFGASLEGIGVNLLVSDVGASVAFARDVFAASVVYADEDFAVVRTSDGTLLLHADHAYDRHPFSASVAGHRPRPGDARSVQAPGSSTRPVNSTVPVSRSRST